MKTYWKVSIRVPYPPILPQAGEFLAWKAHPTWGQVGGGWQSQDELHGASYVPQLIRTTSLSYTTAPQLGSLRENGKGTHEREKMEKVILLRRPPRAIPVAGAVGMSPVSRSAGQVRRGFPVYGPI